MKTLVRHLAFLLAAAASLPAFAGDTDISIADPYVRMVPPGTSTTGAFMVVKNGSNADRKLVKADSPVARAVELHNHINDNGVMKMRQVPEIDIKAKGETALKPGSYHVMLIDLKQALKEGDSVPMTLTFDDGSTRKIDVPVKMPQAMMPMEGDHGKMKH
jgi:periplasmic copper chaperone A